MRGFFFLLILTNLALAGWLYWQDRVREVPPLSEAQETNQGRLYLLNELPPESLQTIPQEPATADMQKPDLDRASSKAPSTTGPETVIEGPAPLVNTVTCMRIAPLPKQSDVEVLTRKLTQESLAVLNSGEGFTERETYWVMITPYKSEKEARNAAAQLAKAKVRDFLVIRTGEFVNGISLGLFSQKEGAENRLREIQSLNLKIRKPEIRPRTTSVRSHWLEVQLSGNEELKTLEHQLEPYGLQSMQVACPP